MPSGSRRRAMRGVAGELGVDVAAVALHVVLGRLAGHQRDVVVHAGVARAVVVLQQGALGGEGLPQVGVVVDAGELRVVRLVLQDDQPDVGDRAWRQVGGRRVTVARRETAEVGAWRGALARAIGNTVAMMAIEAAANAFAAGRNRERILLAVVMTQGIVTEGAASYDNRWPFVREPVNFRSPPRVTPDWRPEPQTAPVRRSAQSALLGVITTFRKRSSETSRSHETLRACPHPQQDFAERPSATSKSPLSPTAISALRRRGRIRELTTPTGPRTRAISTRTGSS